MKSTLALLMISAVLPAAGQNVEVSVKASPAMPLKGMPVTFVAQVKNVSGRPIESACGVLEVQPSFRVIRDKDTPATCGFHYPTAGGISLDKFRLGTGEAFTHSMQLDCDSYDAPLKIEFTLQVCSAVPFKVAQEKDRDIWSGSVKAETLVFKYQEPAGVDADAYAYFKGKPVQTWDARALVDRYPESEYTMYFLPRAFPPKDIDSRNVAGSADDLLALCKKKKGMLVADTLDRKRGMVPLDHLAQERVNWLEKFLTAHPNHDSRPTIEYRLGTYYLYLSNAVKAQSHFQWVADHVSSDNIFPYAKTLAEHLRERNGQVKQE